VADHSRRQFQSHTPPVGFTATARAAGTQPSPSIKPSGTAGSSAQPGARPRESHDEQRRDHHGSGPLTGRPLGPTSRSPAHRTTGVHLVPGSKSDVMASKACTQTWETARSPPPPRCPGGPWRPWSPPYAPSNPKRDYETCYDGPPLVKACRAPFTGTKRRTPVSCRTKESTGSERGVSGGQWLVISRSLYAATAYWSRVWHSACWPLGSRCLGLRC
jgi:hypothetical protein